MRGLGFACNNEHYHNCRHANSRHKILLTLGRFEKPLINLYYTDVYVVYRTITLLDKRRLSHSASTLPFNSPLS